MLLLAAYRHLMQYCYRTTGASSFVACTLPSVSDAVGAVPLEDINMY